MATRCKARQDRWSWNITFGTPVSITIREADVPDMETKNKREGGILSGRGGGGRETFHPAKRKGPNKSKHNALKLQWNII